MFQKIFDARLRDLWTLYEATGELGHNGEKGLLREVFLRRVVESLLPPQFAVGSGIIIDAAGRQSPQADLVIYDRRRLPPIFEEHGHGVYPIDAVLRFIEVKSVLDKAGLKQFARLVDALRPSNPEALRITAHGTLDRGQAYYPLVSLFAYRTSIVDVQKAVAKVATFDGISAPICVVDQPSVGGTRSRFEDKIRIFLIQILDALEESSSSRKLFGVAEWLSTSQVSVDSSE